MTTPLSVRLDDELLERLRALAAAADVTVSDLVRAAAKRLVEPKEDLVREPVGYRCEHITITAVGLRPPVTVCCRMQPIYS